MTVALPIGMPMHSSTTRAGSADVVAPEVRLSTATPGNRFAPGQPVIATLAARNTSDPTSAIKPIAGCPRADGICAYTPGAIRLFAAYAAAMVNRYMPGGTLARTQGWRDGYGITAWEVWNEPSNVLFWRHDITGYVDIFMSLLGTTTAAIHGADPGAHVMVDDSGHGFTPAFAAHPGAFDVLAVHSYTGGLDPDAALAPPPLTSGGFGSAPSALGPLVRRGHPVWVTETGYPSASSVTARQQAQYLVRGAVNELVAGVKKTFWFKFREDRAGEAGTYGLVTWQGLPKPAYAAYATMTRHLDGSVFATSVNLGSVLRAALFSAPGNTTTAVLWSTAEAGTIGIPLTGAQADDVMDNPTGRRDGRLLLPISADPIFLTVHGMPASVLSMILAHARVAGWVTIGRYWAGNSPLTWQSIRMSTASASAGCNSRRVW